MAVDFLKCYLVRKGENWWWYFVMKVSLSLRPAFIGLDCWALLIEGANRAPCVVARGRLSQHIWCWVLAWIQMAMCALMPAFEPDLFWSCDSIDRGFGWPIKVMTFWFSKELIFLQGHKAQREIYRSEDHSWCNKLFRQYTQPRHMTGLFLCFLRVFIANANLSWRFGFVWLVFS